MEDQEGFSDNSSNENVSFEEECLSTPQQRQQMQQARRQRMSVSPPSVGGEIARNNGIEKNQFNLWSPSPKASNYSSCHFNLNSSSRSQNLGSNETGQHLFNLDGSATPTTAELVNRTSNFALSAFDTPSVPSSRFTNRRQDLHSGNPKEKKRNRCSGDEDNLMANPYNLGGNEDKDVTNEMVDNLENLNLSHEGGGGNECEALLNFKTSSDQSIDQASVDDSFNTDLGHGLNVSSESSDGNTNEGDYNKYHFEKMAKTFFDTVKKFGTPKERRHLMSIIVSAGFENSEASKLLDMTISKHEWAKARRHSMFPGAGAPICAEPKYFRMRLNDEVVATFLQWLHSKNYLQDLSFGHKVVKYCNGTFSTLEAVKLTSNIAEIIKEYAKEWQHQEAYDLDAQDNVDGEDDAADDENSDDNDDGVFVAGPVQCTVKCKKTGNRCMKTMDHSGRHKFTQLDRLSPSSITKILQQLTDGKIKSLAGLDDIDSEMGGENFEQMKSIVKTLGEVARLNNIDTRESQSNLLEKISKVINFHKVGFSEHLGRGA